MSEHTHFLGDNPIEGIDEDLFNFEHYALKVQKLIQLNSSNSNPLTIGIYGKWGEGKTSFLNLLENKIDVWKKEEEQKGILKYHFNPWRYSSEEEMLFDFFDGLAKTMFVEKDSNLQKVGRGILRFSKYIKAVKISASAGISPTNKISATLEPSEIFKALGEDLIGKDITLDTLKNKINDTLKTSNYKIVVFIDDVDRLDKDEIYTVLKLIKLNGSFKNFVYLVTLDSEQVSKAISNRYGKENIDGRFFLEKIINVPIILPRIEEEDLQRFFEKKLNQIKNNLLFEKPDLKEKEFFEIVAFFTRELFNSPREIIRVLNSFFITAFAVSNEVNLFDLFILEYIKIKNETCYNYLKNYSLKQHVLLGNIIDFNDDFLNKDDDLNGSREIIKKKFPDMYVFVNKLFPLNKKIIDYVQREKELRVNFKMNFDVYFSYHMNRKISNSIIYRIEDTIKSGNETLLKKQFEEMFSARQNYKALYMLENFISNTSELVDRSFFFKFVFDNLHFINEKEKDDFGRNYRFRVIERIGVILSSNSKFDLISILKLADKLNIRELCIFLQFAKDERNIELGKLLLEKIAEYIKNDNLYREPLVNRLVLRYWSEFDNKGLNEYLDKNLVDMKNVKLLIRNFPSFWNNSFFGGLNENKFHEMKRVINIDLVYRKILKFDSKLVKSIDISDFETPSDFSKSTSAENVKQFIYWYKLELRKKTKLIL